ncbi:putative reverse transcriptase domain-containing protein [Tanacetum coccineum]
MLESDRPFHGRTAILMEEEARLSRAAWAQSMDVCDQTHSEGILLRTTLLKADYRRQRQLVETLNNGIASRPQMIEIPRQPGPAKDPAEPRGYQRSRQPGMATIAIPQELVQRRMNVLCGNCTYQYFHEMSTHIPSGITEEVVQLDASVRRGCKRIPHKRINTCAETKRNLKTLPRNNQTYQQTREAEYRAGLYAAGNGDRKPYEGTKPRCPKCNFNHHGPCTPKCTNCRKLGHLAKDCRSRPATANNNNRNNNNNNNRNNNNPRAQGANTNAIVCFECGTPGHFRSNCPQWKTKNQGNGSGVARAYAVGVAGQNPDNNVVTGTFLLNNRCASILFDTGADRSFVSTQFSTLINIAPTTLDHGYNVELADGSIIWVNMVLLGCTLNFLNHPFHVDLMPVEMGTYDVIIGMDWLTKYQAVIDCAKKIVRIPFGSEILIFHGDGSRNKRGTRLNIISCTKAQKYVLQGCHVFLAHITVKETGDKSKKKQLEEVPIVKNFPEVFPEDLPGLPPTRQVEFHIDLVPGAAPVARAPYR